MFPQKYAEPAGEYTDVSHELATLVHIHSNLPTHCSEIHVKIPQSNRATFTVDSISP